MSEKIDGHNKCLIFWIYFLSMWYQTESESIDTDIINDDENDIILLTESDIPGASLEGKDPTELNVSQLKRWLACRGAPVNGKKPELIQR